MVLIVIRDEHASHESLAVLNLTKMLVAVYPLRMINQDVIFLVILLLFYANCCVISSRTGPAAVDADQETSRQWSNN